MDIYLTTSELAELEKTQTQIPGQLQHILYKDVQWQDEYGAKGWDRVIASKSVSFELVMIRRGCLRMNGREISISFPGMTWTRLQSHRI